MTDVDRAGPAPAGPHARPGNGNRRRCRPGRLAALTLVAMGCVAAAPLSAGPLADPTRPPAHLAPAQPSAAALPNGGAAARPPVEAAALPGNRQAVAAPPIATPAAAAAPPSPPPLASVVLQSVQSPARGPAAALINGQLVKIGDSVAGRLVHSIDARSVVLQGNSTGPERLWLLGDGSKQAAGSLRSSRSAQYTPAQYTPAQDNPETNAAGEAAARADRTDRASPPGTLSLARRTQP